MKSWIGAFGRCLKISALWIANNWERIALSLIGFAFLGFSFSFLLDDAITKASAVFGMAFLSLIFASLARFKRFKGLGFEAELWEDKQKEAAQLIDQLRGIITLYSREAIMSRVMMNRWGGHPDGWKSHWNLFEKIDEQHKKLGQEIDLSDLKRELDGVFTFDMVGRHIEKIRKPIRDGRAKAREKIASEFGDPVRDSQGHRKRLDELELIPENIERSFELSQKCDLADSVLIWAQDSKSELDTRFNVEIEFDQEDLDVLREISKAYKNRPIVITDRLLNLANPE